MSFAVYHLCKSLANAQVSIYEYDDDDDDDDDNNNNNNNNNNNGNNNNNNYIIFITIIMIYIIYTVTINTGLLCSINNCAGLFSSSYGVVKCQHILVISVEKRGLVS